MRTITTFLLATILGTIICELGMTKTTTAQIKIGIFADCQYCNCEPAGNRYYKNSLNKLDKCIFDFNQNNEIDFVVGLGDLIDRDFASFSQVNAVLAKSNNKVYNVSGNHDYAINPEYFNEVPNQLNLKNNYYTLEHKNWLFIFLDGNDITLQSNNNKTVEEAKNLLSELTRTNQPNNKEWNGGIGKKQISWLKKQLNNAENKSLNVALFCHYPLLPLEAHALWNSTEVLSVLNKYACVKVWINGHNHAGGYALQNGVHFITLNGMVDTETENAYAVLSISEKEIKIVGAGRQESKILPIKH
jgi:predicted phosphodiesterase